MENEVYTRDYTGLVDDDAVAYSERWCRRLGELAHNLNIQQPKIISAKGKAAYEYFRQECDKLARTFYGKIYAVIDFQSLDAKIKLTVPSVSFCFAETKSLLVSALLDTQLVSFATAEDGKGTEIEIQIDYFEQLPYSESEEGDSLFVEHMKTAAEKMAAGNPELLDKINQLIEKYKQGQLE